MRGVERFYSQHEKLINVLAATFIAGGVLSNLYVTRDAARETTASLTQKIDGIARAMNAQAQQQAVTDYRLDQVEHAVASLEGVRR